MCTVSDLEEHSLIHEGILRKDGKLQCIDCDKIFANRGGLRGHLNRFHNKKDWHKFECDECGKTFPIKQMLDYHKINKHTTIEHLQAVSSQCKACQQDFENAELLNQHQLTCLEKPESFPCKECETKVVCKGKNLIGGVQFLRFECRNCHVLKLTCLKIDMS